MTSLCAKDGFSEAWRTDKLLLMALAELGTGLWEETASLSSEVSGLD